MHQIHPIHDLRIPLNPLLLRHVPKPLLHLQPDLLLCFPLRPEHPSRRGDRGRVVEDPGEKHVTQGEDGGIVVDGDVGVEGGGL